VGTEPATALVPGKRSSTPPLRRPCGNNRSLKPPQSRRLCWQLGVSEGHPPRGLLLPRSSDKRSVANQTVNYFGILLKSAGNLISFCTMVSFDATAVYFHQACTPVSGFKIELVASFAYWLQRLSYLEKTASGVCHTKRKRDHGTRSTRAQHTATTPMPVHLSATKFHAFLRLYLHGMPLWAYTGPFEKLLHYLKLTTSSYTIQRQTLTPYS
jgi:hypothetical protein